VNQKVFEVNAIINYLEHGSPTHRPPDCIIGPQPHLSKKLQNTLGGYIYHLLLFFHVQPTNQPTIMGVALCHKKVGHPWSRTWDFEEAAFTTGWSLLIQVMCEISLVERKILYSLEKKCSKPTQNLYEKWHLFLKSYMGILKKLNKWLNEGLSMTHIYLHIARWAAIAVLSMLRAQILKLCTLTTPGIFRNVFITWVKSIPLGSP
jgi:hypothetical protein